MGGHTCPQTPDPDKKDAQTVLLKASRSTLGNLSHLLSLSTTQILACAHQLLDLPLTDIGTPKPTTLPELNTSANPSISPDPKIAAIWCPHCLRDTRRLKIMSIPSGWPYLRSTVFSIVYHQTLSFHFQFCQNTLQTSFLLKYLLRKEGRKWISTCQVSYSQKKKSLFFFWSKQGGGNSMDPTEHGNFRKDYFEPIIILTVPHMPWVEHNIPNTSGKCMMRLSE